MSTIASESMMPATGVAPTEGMATTVLMVEWIVKQLQMLKEKQSQIESQERQIEALKKENEQLKDSLDKLKNRDSENSSIPPSQDLLKKPSDKSKRKKGKKRGPKYNHPGKTRNGFGKPDQIVSLELENCPLLESELEAVLNNPPKKGWAADAIGLRNRLKRHWDQWFTFLSHPEVKPDNNDAERALRPVVIHRKVSGGARSDWGAELVAQMFSFLETMRLQGNDAIAQLCELLSLAGRSPPGLHST